MLSAITPSVVTCTGSCRITRRACARRWRHFASAATPREIAPLHAGQLCERRGIRVYVISAGGDVPRDPGTARPDHSQMRELTDVEARLLAAEAFQWAMRRLGAKGKL